ncbi:hypothetical protein WJX72_003164 [[Myrmecia] bisecta]|uniref:Haloacid dehalogenase-like hydrolase domain-containing protein 3 n=1 Tax=[Myrmecia] bisecta TaxID=41462 RepID=A0AAW1QPN7_9CHLO
MQRSVVFNQLARLLSKAPAQPLPAAAYSNLRALHLAMQHGSESHFYEPHYKALLVDAAGTLLVPSEPAAQVYLRYGTSFGCTLTELEILQRFRRSYNEPWGHSTTRYVGDGRPFWSHIVAESTGCQDPTMFEQIYEYYARPEAWKLTPGAAPALQRLKDAGMKLAVVSNFDTRLRPLLHHLGVASLFDTIVVSAEIGAEKPNPIIFETACQQLGVAPEEAVHVGDDRRNDIYGARDAGCFAWMWGLDVHSFDEVAARILTGASSDDEDWPGNAS